MTATPAPIGMRVKLAYGLGAVTLGVRDTGFNTFILIFYNQVLGLSAALAGLALMLTLFADALIDPLVGLASDACRSRLGRRHPFLYAAAVPAAASYALLWNVPGFVHGAGLFWWLLGVSILARGAMSLFEVPFVSMVAEITTDYDQRTNLITWLYVFGWWSGLATAVTAYGVFLRPTAADPSGLLGHHGFAAFGLAGSATMVIAILISALGSQGRATQVPAAATPRTRGEAWRTMRGLLANRSLAALLVSVILLSAGQGFGNSVWNYIQVFFWGLNSGQIAQLALAPVVSATLVLLLGPRLARGREKRDLAIASAVIAVVGQPLPVVLRLLGLFPAPGSPVLMPILILHSAFETTVWVLFSILSSSMVADLVEAHQTATRDRAEGALFALRIFAQKTVSGLGVLVTGLVLGAIGFPAGGQGHPSPVAVAHLGIAYAIAQLAFGLASAAVLRGYVVTRAVHARNLAVLAG